MTATTTISADDVFTVVRQFLLGIINTEVVQGLQNRVPMPRGGFIAMTALNKSRLATNIDTYDNLAPTPGNKTVQLNTTLHLQLDCYGPDSFAWADLIAALWRDDYAVQAMANVLVGATADGLITADSSLISADATAYRVTVTPLYCEDPRLIAIDNAEKQNEQRWMVEAVLQYNPVVVIAQQFAGTLGPVGVISVDATYP